MPTSLPDVNSQLNYAMGRSGKSIEELQKGIETYKKNFAAVIANSPRLITYLYLKNELGIEIVITKELGSDNPMTIADFLKSNIENKIALEGIVLSTWERDINKKTVKEGEEKTFKQVGMTLADKTGAITITASFDDRIKIFKGANIKREDYIIIQGLNLNTYKRGPPDKQEVVKDLQFGADTIVGKAKVPNFTLDEVPRKIAELKDKQRDILQVTVLTREEQTYIGCPYDSKGLGKDVTEGQTATCPKCKKSVVGTKMIWQKYLASDGESDVTVTLSPKDEKTVLSIGKAYNCFGKYDSKKNSLNVDWFKLVSGFEEKQVTLQQPQEPKTETQPVQEKPSEPIVATPKPVQAEQKTVQPNTSDLAVKEKILATLSAWNKMQREKLIQNAVKLMKLESSKIETLVDELLKEGKIEQKNGSYQIPRPEKKEEQKPVEKPVEQKPVSTSKYNGEDCESCDKFGPDKCPGDQQNCLGYSNTDNAPQYPSKEELEKLPKIQENSAVVQKPIVKETKELSKPQKIRSILKHIHDSGGKVSEDTIKSMCESIGIDVEEIKNCGVEFKDGFAVM